MPPPRSLPLTTRFPFAVMALMLATLGILAPLALQLGRGAVPLDGRQLLAGTAAFAAAMLALAGLVGWLLARSVARPLEELRAAMEAVAQLQFG